ncbi:MAG: TIGR00153 family protein [Pseudomonadales bacterium]|nr:TIGR00153 family protein [Pseudomonadales bacterium]
MASGTTLGNLFGRSPIVPIQEHMTKVLGCAELLEPFFKAVLAKDWETATDLQQQISFQEREADALKKNLRRNMPKSLFMAIPRSDLLELISMQDKVANCAKDVAGIVLGRKMEIPEQLSARMDAYVSAALNTSKQALRAINELDELVETGFGNRELHMVDEMIGEIDQIEQDADGLERELRKALFDIERDLYAVDVVFLYRVIEGIGELADLSQRVGSRLQIIIAR